MKQAALYIAVLLCLASCSGSYVYSHYEALPINGWQADSAVDFRFEIADSLEVYDIVLNLRHSERYPYQNVWFFTELCSADSVQGELLLKADTLEYYLADRRGIWLGNGFGRLKDMPMLLKAGYSFPHAGEYVMHVRQGMREELLTGVSDLGLSILQVK